MTSFRARLPWRDGFSKNELHAFHLGKIVGFCYSINKGNYVWSMAVPDALLHSLEGQDGDNIAEGKENARNGIKANSLQASQSCLECPSHECCLVQNVARCAVTIVSKSQIRDLGVSASCYSRLLCHLNVVHAVQAHHLVLPNFTHCRSLPARTTQ